MCDLRRGRGDRRQHEGREGEQAQTGRDELLAHEILPFLDAQLGWALIELSGRLPARRAPRGLLLPAVLDGLVRRSFYQRLGTGQDVVGIYFVSWQFQEADPRGADRLSPANPHWLRSCPSDKSRSS